MFVLRTTLLLAIVATFGPSVEAQLFRFRRPPQPPPQQAPANFNAATYQYTQVQVPVTNVPSQRYVQQQLPQCNQRVVYVPVTQLQQAQRAAVARQFQDQQAQTQQQQQMRSVVQQQVRTVPRVAAMQQRTNVAQPSSQQVVMLSVRDPYSGRVVRRPFVITRRTQLVPQYNQPLVTAVPGNQGPLSPPLTAALASPQQVLSAATPDDVKTPVIEPPTSEKVATTSFESPVEESKGSYSVLDDEGSEIKPESTETKEAKPSLDSDFRSELEADLDSTTDLPDLSIEPAASPAQPVAAPEIPELDLAEPEVVEPGGLKFEETEVDFDLDLPPLGSDGT